MGLIYILFMEESVTKPRTLTSYYKFKQGGLCTRLLRAMNALLKSGYEVHYLSVKPFPIAHPNCIHHKFKWPFKNEDTLLFWLYFTITSPVYIFSICVKHKITHLFAFDVVYAFVMQPARSYLKLPLPVFFRADSITNHKIKKVSRILILIELCFEKIALSGAKAYCVSNSLLKNLKERNQNIQDGNFIYFPNDLKIENVIKHDLNIEKVSLSCIGVYEERKNQEFLLYVMQQVRNNNWVLNLYGAGPLQQKLYKKIKELNLKDKVILQGWVPREQLWKNTDLLLMPSQHEGAPNAILEALGNRIPILASDIPEHREILPNKNLFKLDILLWTNEIDRILDDARTQLDEINTHQIKCINKFIFDWDKTIVEYIVRKH